MEDIRSKVELAVNVALDKGLNTNIELTDEDIADEVMLTLNAEEYMRSIIIDVINEVFHNNDEVGYTDIINEIVSVLSTDSTDEAPF